MRVNDIGDRIGNVLRALANRLTAADNFGPEGKKWQVLTSNGPRPVDPPPSYQDIQNVISGVIAQDPELITGIPGLQGPPGPQGEQGPPGDPVLFGDLDGGEADSVYGGGFVIDGGGI